MTHLRRCRSGSSGRHRSGCCRRIFTHAGSLRHQTPVR